MTTAVDYKYKVGDEVVVTGDRRRWGHAFYEGTHGKVLELGGRPPGEPVYRVLGLDTYGEEDDWWVHEMDLDPLEPLAEWEKELLYGDTTESDRAIEELREKLTEADMVNHPPHYTSHPKGIECIDVIEDGPHFNLNQAIRYVWRVNWGGKWDDVEDLRKAVWYLEREIDRRLG